MSEQSIEFKGRTITLLVGDITEQDAEAIVNAANHTLLGGGGVDGAIHRAAGPQLIEACKEIKKKELIEHRGLLPTGQAVITDGYRLPAKYVIHTVGPICGKDQHPEQLLRNAYLNSLQLADDNRIQSIAFPSISTGAYGCPIRWAAIIAMTAIKDFLHHATFVKHVRIVLFKRADYEVYEKVQ